MNRRLLSPSVCLFAICVLAAAPAHGVSDMLRAIEQDFVELGAQILPSVVNIDVKAVSRPGGSRDIEGFEDIFKYFGMPVPEGQEGMPFRMPPQMASGSGFIYDAEGHIVTNSHVVKDAGTITVRLSNGREYVAEPVGSDPQTDLAVIKITSDTPLTPIPLGDSDALHVGQFAVAVGSPRGLQGSLSFGHVTALQRNEVDLELRFKDFIQTDAAINLGNSGGPLCNIDGQVIGINTAIVMGAESLGFAIPVNFAKKIVPVLINEGKVTRGYLGVRIKDADEYAGALNLPDGKGAFIDGIAPDTPAAKAGLQDYDVVLKVNGEAVDNSADLQNKISDMAPGDTANLDVWRDGEMIQVPVVLEEFPDDTLAASLGRDILGLRVQPLTPAIINELQLDVESNTTGVVVVDVDPDSPSYDAGIRTGDVVTEIAKQPVTSTDDFRRLMLENAKPGESLLLQILRRAGMSTIVAIKVPSDYEMR